MPSAGSVANSGFEQAHGGGSNSVQPSGILAIVTSTNSIRRLNLNQRRFGLVSVMADPHVAGRVQFTVVAEG